MKGIYEKSGWRKEHFRQLSKHEFEDYYPNRFSTKIEAIKSVDKEAVNKDAIKTKKRKLKKELLDEVKTWYKCFPDEAKIEFAVSAKDVIDILKEIEITLNI